MPPLSERALDTAQRYRNSAMDGYWGLRRRYPSVDHLVRAYERYSDRNGTQLAGAVTYFTFLSFFPLMALAFAGVGFLANQQVELTSYLERALDDVLPGLAQQLPMDQIARARVGASVVGLLGLLYAGLNSVWSLRQALHAIWLKSFRQGPNFVLRKLGDLLVMLGLGGALLFTVAFTSFMQTATVWLLSLVGLDGSLVANLALRALALVIAIAVNMCVFVFIFSVLSGDGGPSAPMWRGALLGAVAFEVLKYAAALLLAGTLGNPVYASFAVLVGLLVWINLVIRVVLFSAAWTATWLAVPPPYTGSLTPPEESGMDWTRPRPVLRPSPEALAERRLAQRLLSLGLALVGAALAAGVAAVASRSRR
ncbi:YihY/virulence factor BrkB family protein [Nocardiopsis sp. NPDC006938]|uniref:YihY/virulence factor BrkB family protein n=1 Tax=Nocardiopsis sp. NPDC006938 TaxID=3364337 RepID=UPI0036D0FCC9